jgi:phage major head subunit gpT-like protein
MTVNTGSFPKELRPGLKSQFTGIANSEKAVWKQLYETVASKLKYEEIISQYQFGLVEEKPEGQAMTLDNMSQGLTIRHTHKSYGKGCKITREALADNQYANLTKRATKYLSNSHFTTQELVHANRLNNGFTVAGDAQEGGDGLTLFNASHTLKNGVYSNLLTAGSLSRTALQDAITQINLIKDETGIHFSNITEECLVVPQNLKWTAEEILGSAYQPDNANNAINTMFGQMKLIVWKYLTSTTAWFIKTNAQDGLIHYDRVKPEIEQVNPNDGTYNVQVQSYSRYVCGVANVRGIFGNTGA